MKCYDIGILQAYIDGEVSQEIMKAVDQHLDKCEVCQRQFEELIEMNEWEIGIKDQEIQIDAIDVKKAWQAIEGKLENTSKIYQVKGVFKDMNKMKKFTAVAAASLLIITGLPVVAKGVYNLFSSQVLEDDIVNNGFVREDGTVVDATKDGVFKPLDTEITDQNITIRLTELYVAESRVSVHYRIEDENGNLVPIEYDTEGLDLKYDGIVDGKQVDAPEYHLDKELESFPTVQFLGCEDALPFELMKEGQSLDIGIRELGSQVEGTITFAGFNPIDYPVTLDINIEKIGKTEGNWKGQVEINPN